MHLGPRARGGAKNREVSSLLFHLRCISAGLRVPRKELARDVRQSWLQGCSGVFPSCQKLRWMLVVLAGITPDRVDLAEGEEGVDLAISEA